MNLGLIFDKLILPNICLMPEDVQEYEDDPDSYIRNDLEESDTETNRRHCMKFAQQLSRKFPDELSVLMAKYISRCQEDFTKDGQSKWMQKVSLMNLLLTATILQYSYKDGAVDIIVDQKEIFGYIQGLALPELQEATLDQKGILKATCIKFVYMFRNQIPGEQLTDFILLFARFLNSEKPVNQSYAAVCIEKLIAKRDWESGEPMISSEVFNQKLASTLLTNFTNLLVKSKNLYAMRGLYRVAQHSGQGIT